MIVRDAIAAGSFYPGSLPALKSYLDGVMGNKENKISPIAIVVPHAGYIYSGAVAAKAYSMLENYDTYIILGPNHTGLGAAISTFEGEFDMLYGAVKTDDEAVDYIIANSSAEIDAYAHMNEHSIEVQLPFIDYISHDYKVVPIVIGTLDSKRLSQLGHTISNFIKRTHKKILIVVSSDMNHYEDEKTTLKKDRMAIEKIEQLDEGGLINTVERFNISMCGIACAYTAIVASKDLGAKKAELIEHRTSGEVNGDYAHVVGYTSIIIE